MDSISHEDICPLCDDPIALSGDSSEHIIPNSIGGRRTIRGFICKDCNSRTGNSWDAEIWRQFSHVAMMHGVERDRGEPPSIQIHTVDGNRYLLLPNGNMTIEHPKFSAEEGENGTDIRISARDEREARRMVKQVVSKYPQLDPQTILGAMSANETPLESPVSLSSSFGGELAGRSMVKSAVALAATTGVDARACDSALRYLKDYSVTPSYAFFYVRDLVANRPDFHAINCVSVVGDPSRHTLLGYVEYFSMSRIVVILSEAYDGQPLSATYAFNPATGDHIDARIDLNLSDAELELVRTNNATTDESYRAALDAGFSIVYNRSQLRHWQRETDEAFERACKTMGIPRNGVVPSERAQEFSRLMVEYLGPMIERLVRR
ncbi:HNH endonuclease [Paraburkholderia tagetis]|uniref:HNH endonuclease n=1 Tax=Paraburkholderia tagetis TaxID=2913261 RepID=A0A9X1RQA1_9BURK|nr:HNH endonuclease [Paraburkholderia tagetis]MCG5076351.1 HNH endonuclease [Paraburkholderia tagetis]